MSPRILAFAYACEPGKGSEPGAGWSWARMLAELGETWVITRANNAPAIEAILPATKTQHELHFVYVDLPPWARFWKKGQRGVRLYYLLWQYAALRVARRLSRVTRFDLVWHLTLANVWLGSVAHKLGLPFIYGPVGGGVRAPRRLWCALGARGVIYEVVREAMRSAGRYLNPAARAAWRTADLILVQNPETQRWLPARHQHKAMVFCNAIVEDIREGASPGRGDVRTALFAGRLLGWKGAALAVRAIMHAPGWRLLICGRGPDQARLGRLADSLGVNDRVQILGPLERQEVLRNMDEADVFLCPSLHDDSPLVVTEAVSRGLPIVCLDRGGPPILAGSAGVVVSSDGDCRAVSERLAERGLNGTLPSRRQVLERAEELSFEATVRKLDDLVGDVLKRPLAGPDG